jgi:hypothetical protein
MRGPESVRDATASGRQSTTSEGSEGMSGLLKGYRDLWRDALGDGSRLDRWTARLAILAIHSVVIAGLLVELALYRVWHVLR